MKLSPILFLSADVVFALFVFFFFFFFVCVCVLYFFLYFSFIFSTFIVSCLNYPENPASLLRVVYQLITSKPIFFVTLAFSLSFFLNYLLNNVESNFNYFIELQNNFHTIPELVRSITVVISPLCIFIWETLLKLSFWYFAQLYFHACFYLAAYICKVNVSLSAFK